MSLFKAELLYFFRSPIIWVIVAFSAVVSAWFLLLSVELFSTIQIKFAHMSDAPTVLQGVIFPVISAQAKLSTAVVAMVAGLSFSRLNNSNGWFLINAQQRSDWYVIVSKYMAILLVSVIFMLPSLLAILSVVIMADLPLIPVIVAIVGLLLLVMWMLSMGLFISSVVNNSGFAILLCLVTLAMLWLLSQSGLDAQWGKNWLQVFSPQYHFGQFLSSYLSLASVFYFTAGVIVLLTAIKIRLVHKRYVIQ